MNPLNRFHLVVPITCSSIPIAVAGPYQYSRSEPINENLLENLTLYGQLAGSAFLPVDQNTVKKPLSRREIEVLQRLSFGESMKEIAAFIKISEYTVQDYVKSSLRKLEAHNRVEGVAM